MGSEEAVLLDDLIRAVRAIHKAVNSESVWTHGEMLRSIRKLSDAALDRIGGVRGGDWDAVEASQRVR